MSVIKGENIILRSIPQIDGYARMKKDQPLLLYNKIF
jgi:hypothetical protein